MLCSYSSENCSGPPKGERGWHCPVLNCRLTVTLTTLCRTNPAYYRRWKERGGPYEAQAVEAKQGKAAKKAGCGGCGDKKKALTLMGEAWDVIKAVGKFVGSLGQLTSREEYQRRLNICTGCENRGDERVKGNQHRCGECGCFVAIKAQAVAWECPIGKWSVCDSEQNAADANLNAR